MLSGEPYEYEVYTWLEWCRARGFHFPEKQSVAECPVCGADLEQMHTVHEPDVAYLLGYGCSKECAEVDTTQWVLKVF